VLIGAIGAETRTTSDTMTAGSGFTLLANASAINNGQPSSSITIFPEFETVNAQGTYTASGTLSSGNNRNWAAIIVAYKTQ
jgi:hypothetical protein